MTDKYARAVEIEQSLDAFNTKSKKRLEQIRQEASTLGDIAGETVNTNKLLEQRVSSLTKELQQKEEQVQREQQTLRERDSQLDAEKQQLLATIAQKDELQSENVELSRKIGQIEAEKAEISQRILSSTGQLESVGRILEQTKQEQAKLEEQIKTAQNEFMLEKLALNRVIEKINSEFDESANALSQIITKNTQNLRDLISKETAETTTLRGDRDPQGMAAFLEGADRVLDSKFGSEENNNFEEDNFEFGQLKSEDFNYDKMLLENYNNNFGKKHDEDGKKYDQDDEMEFGKKYEDVHADRGEEAEMDFGIKDEDDHRGKEAEMEFGIKDDDSDSGTELSFGED